MLPLSLQARGGFLGHCTAMSVARILQQLQQLNDLLQHQPWPRLFEAAVGLRTAILRMEGSSPGMQTLQRGTPAECAALAR